jgi:hypothetical protein
MYLGTLLRPCGSTAVVRDLSSTGLLLETSADLNAGHHLEVDLPLVGAKGAKVMWRDGRLFGCRFGDPISKSAVNAALLASEPAQAPKQPLDAPARLELAASALAADEARGSLSASIGHLSVRQVGGAAVFVAALGYGVFTGGTVALVIVAVLALMILLTPLFLLWGLADVPEWFR